MAVVLKLPDANPTDVVPISLGGTNATTAAGALINLGGTTIGQNLFTLPDPSAVTFPRFNADNTVSALNITAYQTAIGASATAAANTLVLRDSGGSFLATNGGFSGQIATTRTWDGANNKGQILLTGLFGNRIDYIGLGFGAPSFTTRSIGTKIAFRQSLSASSVDYAVGLTSSSLWHSVPTASETFDWYFGETIRAQLSNTTLIAPSFTRNGGSATEFLKGDGSVDTTIYQPYDADLATIAGFTPTSNNFIVGNGASWTLQTPTQARASLGGTTVGQNLLTLTNPSAVTFPRFNADNTVSTLNATAFLSALGGVVTSVNLTVPTGLTVSGAPITSNGTIAITLSAGYSIPTTTSQSAWDAKVTNVTAASPVYMTGNTTNPVVNLAGGYGDTKNPYGIKPANFFLAGSDGASPPAFRAILAADVPILNQNTTGTAGNVTGIVAIANGGTGANTTATARTNLGLVIGTDVQAYDADLAAIAALSPTADNFIVGNGTAWTLETPAQARASLGGTTIGQSLFMLTDPSAVSFPRFNANNTVSALNASDTRTAIGAGTVNSVGGAGTVSGLTLTGTVTNSGNLTLGGTLAVLPSNFANQTANTVLAGPTTGVAATPSFRSLVASDIPTLNQNTTGTASNVTGTVAIANGGTNATSAAAALSNLGGVGGSGTTNRLAKFTAASTLGDSVFGDDGGSAYLYGSSAANIRFMPGATPTFSAWIRAYTNGGLGIDAGASTDFNYYGTGPVNFWRGTQLGGPGGPVTTIPILQIKNDGNCEFRGPWRSATGGAQIYLNDATGNRIDFNAAGQGFPTTTTRSAGTKIVLSPNLTSTLTDYAIGVVAAGGIFGIWQSVPADNANFYWYAGTNRIATLSGKGYFSANTFQSNGEWSDTSGQLYLNGTTGNRIDFNNNGVAPPSFTTRSVGAKIVLHPAIASNSADYALGIESSRLWFGVPTTTNSFRWYAGTNVVATLLGSGQFSAPNIDASQNLSYNGTLYASGPAEFGGFNYGNGRINMLPSTSGSTKFLDFWSTNQGQQVGSISTNGVNTFYNNSSDYRLKENIAPVENASDKVLRLKPCSFNYIGHDWRVDGFIAHEIQEVADYVVTGEKDAVHEDGSINAQQIDPSKLVPLLTAALQDALKRIENLEKIIANQQGEEHVQ